MGIVKVFLLSILYIFSAFICAIIVTTMAIFGHYYYKLYFTEKPSPQQLQLAEAVVRSTELVVSHWNRYEKCPTSADLLMIKQLSIVENIVANAATNISQCEITIYLAKDQFNDKQIKQLISFKEVAKSPLKFHCYHNMANEFVSSTCKRIRDIDSLTQID